MSLLRVFLPRARPNTARARSLVGETGGVVYLLGLNDLDGDDHDCVVNSDIFVFAHQLKRHWCMEEFKISCFGSALTECVHCIGVHSTQ